MKKKYGFTLVPFVLILLVLAFFFSDKKSQLSVTLGVNLSSGTITQSINTHGGFHGDGTTYTTVSFPGGNGAVVRAIQANRRWTELPLSESLSKLPGYYAPVAEPMASIENGYYFLKNRHPESKDPWDDSAVIGHSSSNFTIAIYDSDANLLHFYQYDS